MIYKDFQETRLSALGLGCMRLPVVNGNNAEVDEAATSEMLRYAFENGINYFDTAWGYHQGNSETVMGKLLKEYPRDSFYLASKFPGYDLPNMSKAEEIFESQLKKCKVDYFDFYLIHNVNEASIESYLDDQTNGVCSYLFEQKHRGRIRHLGFSTHGSVAVMKKFLAAYRNEMEFCQIQLNWFDWRFQHADEKIELLRSYDLPVWVMEPLRGGKLAKLDERDIDDLRRVSPERTAPSWGFDFLRGIDSVTMILSGMSTMQQLKENVRIFSDYTPLTKTERAAILDKSEEIMARTSVPCTKCRYCMEKCPKKLDIPTMMELYNEHSSTAEGKGWLAPMVLSSLPKEKLPGLCIACHNCERVCPQGIHISEIMKKLSEIQEK